MYIVKFIKDQHLASTVNGGKVRIGTFQDFRKMEEGHLRDDTEGAGKLYVKGQDISLDLMGQYFEGPGFNDVTLRFESDAGTLSGDMSMNCFCYCTCYVDDLCDIEILRKKRFPDKDAHFYIANESLFEQRCGQKILRLMKLKHTGGPIYVYCFPGKVTYVDAPKDTTLHYDNDSPNNPVKLNLSYFFEKPTRFAEDQEYRFVWFCTNKPVQNKEHCLYSIVDDHVILDVDTTDCLTVEPKPFVPSKKSISVWELSRP